MFRKSSMQRASRAEQQGVTTLAITLLLLVILTVIVLFSTNVAFFEQRTTTNENRSRLVEQAAEYALNLAGEYMKANRDNLIANETDGWLDPAAPLWVPCADVAGFPNIADFADGSRHPCMSERDAVRRGELYFYASNGAAGAGAAETLVPYRDVMPTEAELEGEGVGGTAAFTATTSVRALLCRIDTSDDDTTTADGTPANPQCDDEPAAGNRVAITLIADATLPNESASATVKEIWGTYSDFTPQSAVPLVAAGIVDGTGNVEIVAAPNAGGYGVPASVWSPSDIDVDKTAGGSAASVSTCYVGEYLRFTPESELKTTCATVNNACGCPAPGEPDFLSGKVPGVNPPCCEGIDILDRDPANPNDTLPDIQFFPGAGIDKDTVDNDDSLFEWVFGVSYEAEGAAEGVIKGQAGATTLMNCGDSGTENCAVYALQEEFGAELVTCAELNALGTTAAGLYYVTDSSAASECDLPAQIGTPDAPAIVVLNDKARLNSTLFYGMLFVRSDNNTAVIRANGNAKVFGSVVVEGSADITGGLTLVYDDTAAGGSTNKLPKSARFGRLPGSWLDDRAGF